MMREDQHHSSALQPSARSDSFWCQQGQTTRISQLISCRRLIESRSRCLRGGLLKSQVGIPIVSSTMNPLRMGACLMWTLGCLQSASTYRIRKHTTPIASSDQYDLIAIYQVFRQSRRWTNFTWRARHSRDGLASLSSILAVVRGGLCCTLTRVGVTLPHCQWQQSLSVIVGAYCNTIGTRAVVAK